MLHGQTAHKKSFFFASGRGSAMILGVSARSRTLPGGLWCPEPPSGTLRTLLGRAGDVPRRSRDACRTLLDVTGRPESLPWLIWNRFWVSRNRFWIHFRVLHCTILDKVARCCPMSHAIGYSCVILRKLAHSCTILHDIAQLPQYRVAQHHIAQYCTLHITLHDVAE